MSKSEEFLRDNNLIQHRSARRRQVLGCIACRWGDDVNSTISPVVHGNQIIECGKIKSGVVYPLLHSLEEAGVLTSQKEDIDASELGRTPRRYYSPADTELGQAFEAALEAPTTCQLPDELK